MNQRFLSSRLLILPACCLLALAVSAGAPREVVADTVVTMEPPPEFAVSEDFRGYFHEATGSSVMVAEWDTPFAEMLESFNDEALEERGVKLLESEQRAFGKRDGRLLLAEQDVEGEIFRKWVAIFGSGETAVIGIAIYAVEHEARMKSVLRDALVSMRWLRDD